MVDVEMYIAQQFYSPEAAAQARRDIKWAIEQMQKELDRAKSAAAIHEANSNFYSAQVAELSAKLRRAKLQTSTVKPAVADQTCASCSLFCRHLHCGTMK